MGFDALTLALPYFEWIEKVFLPILGAFVNVLVVLLGLALNIVLIRAFVKLGALKTPGPYVLLTCLASVDMIAAVLVVIPIIIAQCTGQWLLGDVVCAIHAFLNTWTALVNAWGLVLLCCERAVYFTKPDLHLAHWGTIRKWNIAIGILVSISVVLTAIPFAAFQAKGYQYHSSQYQCVTIHTDYYGTVVGYSTLGFFIPVLLYFLMSIAGLCAARNKTVSDISPSRSESSSEIERQGTSMTTATVRGVDLTERSSSRPASADENESKISKQLLRASLAFNDDIIGLQERDPQRQLLTTSILVSLAAVALQLSAWVCWWVAYAHAIGLTSSRVYDGVWTSVTFIFSITWVVKPAIYISQNKAIRKIVRKACSKKVRRGFDDTVKRMTKAIDGIDKAVFSPRPGGTSVGENVVIAKSYAKRWKNAAGDDNNKVGMVESVEEPTIPGSTATKKVEVQTTNF